MIIGLLLQCDFPSLLHPVLLRKVSLIDREFDAAKVVIENDGLAMPPSPCISESSGPASGS